MRFFLVPKRLVRAHRALPAHSGRTELSFVAACHHCMRRVLLSPPAHFATDGLIRRRPNGLRVSRARFFCRRRFSPFAGMALFAAIRRPSGHTPVICPLFCAAFAPNAQCPRGIGRNCARPCRDVPRLCFQSVLLKKAGRDKRKPRASGSAEARGSRFRVTTSMEV